MYTSQFDLRKGMTVTTEVKLLRKTRHGLGRSNFPRFAFNTFIFSKSSVNKTKKLNNKGFAYLKNWCQFSFQGDAHAYD